MNTDRQYVILVLIGFVLAIPGLAIGADGPVDTPPLACAGHQGGATYTANSNLVVYENDSSILFGTFPDDQTITFGNISFTATDSASLRLEAYESADICLSDISAKTHSITITTNRIGTITVSGQIHELRIYDPEYGVTENTTDVVYNATNSESVTLRLPASNLSTNTTVDAISMQTNRVLHTNHVAANGSVLLRLPAASHRIDVVRNHSTASARQLTANVTISDQQYTNETSKVTVTNATYTGGSFAVAIHNMRAGSPGSIIGWYNASSGVHTNIEVNLNQSMTQNRTVAAVLHKSGRGDPIQVNGSRVSDTATIEIVSSSPVSGTGVQFNPSTLNVGTESTTTVDLQAVNIDNGIKSYSYTVSITNTSVATISGVEVVGASRGGVGTDVSISSDNSMVTVSVAEGDDTNGVFSTLTVAGQNPGTTELTIEQVTLGDDNFNSYNITNTTNATVVASETVAPPAVVGNNRPTDPDGDGKYDDITGDGTVNILDVGALLQNRNSPAVQNNPSKFDFTGDGTVNILDVGKLLQQVL